MIFCQSLEQSTVEPSIHSFRERTDGQSFNGEKLCSPNFNTVIAGTGDNALQPTVPFFFFTYSTNQERTKNPLSRDTEINQSNAACGRLAQYWGVVISQWRHSVR